MVLAVIGAAAPGAGASESGIDVQSRSSWMTPGQPEVHLLLRNPTDRAVEFSLRLGRGSQGKRTQCSKDLVDVDPGFVRRFDGRLGISRIATSGTIPARGWTHRAFAVGAGGMVAPCEVPYVLGLDNPSRTIEGTVTVPGAQPHWEGVAVDEGDLEWESLVESNERQPQRVNARLLLRNRAAHSILVSISERSLNCPEGVAARWALQDSVLQGENIGPGVISAGSWIVFADQIEFDDVANATRCSARIQVSAFTKEGVRPVVSAQFQLAPTSVYSVPFVHAK
jgi:hypothetical protein